MNEKNNLFYRNTMVFKFKKFNIQFKILHILSDFFLLLSYYIWNVKYSNYQPLLLTRLLQILRLLKRMAWTFLPVLPFRPDQNPCKRTP